MSSETVGKMSTELTGFELSTVFSHSGVSIGSFTSNMIRALFLICVPVARPVFALIRKALGDIETPPLFIETRRGNGYRFVGKVSEEEGATKEASNDSFLAKAYAQKGEFDKAFAALENLPPDDSIRATVLATAGRTDEARKIINGFASSEGGSNSPYWVNTLYAAIGDKEKAFEWLEKSYAMRQADLVSIKIDPALDRLHDDPRYTDLLGRVHLDDPSNVNPLHQTSF